MPGTISVDTTSQVFTASRQPDPDLCLIHTTEVWGWPPYAGGGEAPHITVKPIPGKGIAVRVHRPPTDVGKSLANRPGGVETNRRGVWQMELMGTCDPSRKGQLYYWPDADDVVLSALAEYVRPTLVRFKIPFRAVAPFLPYPKSYGSKGGQRLSFAAWNAARGICGHQHAPENDHGDPGAFPIDRFIQHLNQEDDMPSAKEVADAILNAKVVPAPMLGEREQLIAIPRSSELAMRWALEARDNAIQARKLAEAAALKGSALTPDEVKAAVREALSEAAQIDVVVRPAVTP